MEVKEFKALGVKPPESKALIGPRIDINKLFGREITVLYVNIEPSKLPGKEGEKCLYIQITVNGAPHVLFSGSRYLLEQAKQIPPEGYPFRTIIMKGDNDSHQFT